ncbi:MAG: class I SAM-dependent methyltransferase [Verrucomicrobia bacterium]|nr:class I SAM-dependent methyltransferase [Verrucomicrobiota bacterium]
MRSTREGPLCPCCRSKDGIRTYRSIRFPADHVKCEYCGSVYSLVFQQETTDWVDHGLRHLPARKKIWVQEWDQLSASVQGTRILDLGFAAGDFLMEARGRGFTEIMGIDVDANAVSSAPERIGTGSYFCGDFLEIEVPADHFDLVVMKAVIQYVDDISGWMEKAMRSLRPGGAVYVTEPNLYDLAKKIRPIVSRKMNVFTLTGLDNLLRGAGFSVEQLATRSIFRGPSLGARISQNLFKQAVARSIGLLRLDRMLGGEYEMYALGRKR